MTLNQYLDATNLNPASNLSDFSTLCEDAIKYKLFAICVPPNLVEYCKIKLEFSKIKLATVVGFPNGYQLLETKLSETKNLIKLGADEIDFVINRFDLKEKNYSKIKNELSQIVNICNEKNIVSKWIIESPLHDEIELKKLCDIANEIKPSFVKTSTGVYSTASIDSVNILRSHLISSIQIKASGGISDKKTAISFIETGVSRLGVSQYKNLLEL